MHQVLPRLCTFYHHYIDISYFYSSKAGCPKHTLTMRRGYHIFISVEKPSASTSASTSYNSRSGVAQNQYVPSSLFESLPSHSVQSTTRRNTLHHPNKQPLRFGEANKSIGHLDYRLGPIRVDWVDFEESLQMEGSLNKKSSVGKEREGKARGTLAFHTSVYE